MGHNSLFYGAIEEIQGRDTPDAMWSLIQRANEEAIAALSDTDQGRPPLCASMFRVAPDLVTYRARVFTFAATFNGIEPPEVSEGWLSRFEALLSKMYWDHASVVGYGDISRSQISVWRPLRRDWHEWWSRNGNVLPPPITEWDRVLAPIPSQDAPSGRAAAPDPSAPTCPYCRVSHVWGLVGSPGAEGEVRHGCRTPVEGSRMRCAACKRVFFIECGRDGQVRLLQAQQPMWFEFWI